MVGDSEEHTVISRAQTLSSVERQKTVSDAPFGRRGEEEITGIQNITTLQSSRAPSPQAPATPLHPRADTWPDADLELGYPALYDTSPPPPLPPHIKQFIDLFARHVENYRSSTRAAGFLDA